MILRLVPAAALTLMGAMWVSLRAQFDTNRSLNPKLRRYLVAFVCYAVGGVVLILIVPCAHVTAWLIGLGTFAFTIVTRIMGLSWGYLIPELKRVIYVFTAITTAVILLGVFRPDC